MEVSIEDLKRNYKGFSDAELIRIATKDASDLREDAIRVLQEEIKSRGLSVELFKGVEVQRKQITEEEFSDYCKLLQKLPCPVCGSVSHKLNATVTSKVMSFIVITNYEKKLVIGCPACLSKANSNALVSSALLGWWGIPWGFIRTIQAIIFNNKMSRLIWHEEPSDYFRGFVLRNVGVVEANKTNNDRLQSLIRNLS